MTYTEGIRKLYFTGTKYSTKKEAAEAALEAEYRLLLFNGQVSVVVPVKGSNQYQIVETGLTIHDFEVN